METPSHSYGMSLAVWDHTVLPASVTRCDDDDESVNGICA